MSWADHNGQQAKVSKDQLHCGSNGQVSRHNSIDTIQEAHKRVEPAEIESVLVGHPALVDGIRQALRGTRS